MSCAVCAIQKGAFRTEADYREFRTKLAKRVDSGNLEKVADESGSGPFYVFRFACRRCGACWILSVPDQAFRGGWEEIR